MLTVCWLCVLHLLTYEQRYEILCSLVSLVGMVVVVYTLDELVLVKTQYGGLQLDTSKKARVIHSYQTVLTPVSDLVRRPVCAEGRRVFCILCSRLVLHIYLVEISVDDFFLTVSRTDFTASETITLSFRRGSYYHYAAHVAAKKVSHG